jgi:flagellar motor protein MotB
MTPTSQQRSTRYKRLGIVLGVITVLLVALFALSTFWLPGYAKSQLEIHLSEFLQRPVTVASVELKPRTLELTVQGFRIGEKTDTAEAPATLFSFNKLHIGVSFESLKQRAPIVTTVSLTEPHMRLVRKSKDQLNISDILERLQQPSDKESTPHQNIPFSVSNIAIQGGHVEFIDQHENTEHVISEINLGIPVAANINSTQENWIEPHFSAKINDAPFSVDGKLHLFAAAQQAALTIKFNNADLMRYSRYITLPEGIHLLSGFYDSDLNLSFTQEPDKAPEITVSGTTSLRQLALKNSAVATPYQTSLKKLNIVLANVDLDGKKPARIKLHIDQAALTRTGEKEPALSFAKLAIPDITVNTTAQKIALGAITLEGLTTTLRRDAQGNLDLSRLFSSADASAQPAQPTQRAAHIPIPARKPPYPANPVQTAGKEVKAREATRTDSNQDHQPAHAGKSWTPQLKSIQLKAAKLRYEDLSLTKVTPMIIDSLNLALEDIDLDGIEPLQLTLQGRVNQHGNIKASGALAWAPFSADLLLNLTAVDLVSLQGWLGDKLTALLTSGDISFAGNFKASGDPLKIQLNGEGKLANFNIFDSKNAYDLLHWKKLEIGRLNFTNEPLLVDISALYLSDFFARMTILPDGSLNLKQIIQTGKPAEPVTAIATAESKAQNSAGAKSETPVHIGKIYLQQGNINFNDRFIKPNYRANLTALAGQIGPLYPGKSGKIDVRGMVGKTAPLHIHGTIDPFSAQLLMDLVAQVKDIDLPPFSPYSGKYIGYEIEKGKLSADVNYQVENGALTADNKIFLDQFTLGEKVESENAVSLPLDLAITLLKNRRGEINLHLPLKGSIDDPDFNLGDIVFNAFTNMISKAITSPFALLGSVFEGSEELSEISFAPGFADIAADSAPRLKALADILADRPSLKLEISGHIDPETDYEGLKQAMLQSKVKAQKIAEDTKKGIASGTLANITLTPKEYSKYLEIAYKKESFEKPKNAVGLTKSLPDTEMEQLMLAHAVITDSDLQALAENRATAARNWLVENGGISSERIFVTGFHESEDADKKKGSKAEFLLK